MFCRGGTYKTSESPQNRARWGFEDDIECALCGKEESSVTHILTHCQKTLQLGRYIFRQNAVLRVIAHEMQVIIVIGVTQREKKESLVKGINSNNPSNQQIRVQRKSQNNSLEIQKKQGKTETRKNNFVEKFIKVGETRTLSKLSMNKISPSIRKYEHNLKSKISIYPGKASLLPRDVAKHTVTAKGPRGIRNLGNTSYMNEIFQCVAKGASSLRSNPKNLVRKEGRNLQEQVLAQLNLVHSAKGKVIYPV